MPRTPAKRNLWTAADLKLLKQLAGKQSVKRIAKQLKRSEAAVRFKAWRKRIILAHGGRVRVKMKRARLP